MPSGVGKSYAHRSFLTLDDRWRNLDTFLDISSKVKGISMDGKDIIYGDYGSVCQD